MKQGYAPTSYKTNMNNHKQSRKAVSADAKQLFSVSQPFFVKNIRFFPLSVRWLLSGHLLYCDFYHQQMIEPFGHFSLHARFAMRILVGQQV